jgi:hypothetical protein
MPTIAIVLFAIVVLGFLLLSSTIKIVQEYERGVIFRLGRLVGARGPRLFLLIARQAEGRREKRVKVIHAEREFRRQSATRQRRPGDEWHTAGNPATALPTDAQRNRSRGELNHRVSAATRIATGVLQPGAAEPSRQRSQRKRASSSDTCVTSPRMPAKTPSATPRLR